MTDVETSDEPTDAVLRVLTALTPTAAGVEAEREVLRAAFDPDRWALDDLPEVALWLVLKEGGGFDAAEPPVVEIDLRDRVDPAPPDDSVIDVDSRTSSPPPAERRPRRRLLSPRHRRRPEADPASPSPDAGAPLDLRPEPAVPAPPRTTEPVREVEPHLPTESDHPTESDQPVGPTSWADDADDLHRSIERLLAEAIRLPTTAVSGTARPDPYLPLHVGRDISALVAYLHTALDTPLHLRLGDPAASGTSEPDTWWRPALVRWIDDLGSYLHGTLDVTRPPTVRSRRDIVGTAVPDPYWPRHLVRDGRVPDPLPAAPRDIEAVERELRERVDAVELVGDAATDDLEAEIEIALASLTRTEPVDRIGRTYPATFATYLVRRARLTPAAATRRQLRSLGLDNTVGLAFSEALVRLEKPVFRELEQREDVDVRVRYLRRVQLHGGLTPAVVPRVLDALLDSYWSGAGTAREVANDWLTVDRALGNGLGDDTVRLLTRTNLGAALLADLFEVARSVGRSAEADQVHEEDALRGPLSVPVHAAATAWATTATPPTRAWGQAHRPQVLLGDDPGAGPALALPCGTARWHLNGELLGYSSPVHRRVVQLPIARSGKWSVTAGATRRDNHDDDIVVRSAAPDRIVLIFDEHGRLHHRVLPVGGATATVIAPSGSRVTGETDRTLLVGRWIGYERITVDLQDLDELGVSARRCASVSVAVDHSLGANVLPVAPGLLLYFRQHRPVEDDVELVIEDHGTSEGAHLDDDRVVSVRGAYRLDGMISSGPSRDLVVHVARLGLDRSRHVVHVESTAAPSGAVNPATRLRMLLDGVSSAIAGRGTGIWQQALDDMPALDDWERRNGRAIRQWACVTPAIANLDGLRRRAGGRRSRPRTLITLLDAALLEAAGGRRGPAASERLDAAATRAPSAVAATRGLALDYTELQRVHPETRFMPVPPPA